VAGLVRFAVFLLLIFVAVWAGVRVAHAGEDGAIYTGHHYTVVSGDDLWTIAATEYGSSTDLRAAVYAIREANDLDHSVLQPGQRLTLPNLGE
jgi:Tfp pilus assembly protein FimV